MTVSRVDIANMALLKLGQPPIMSLTDNSITSKRVVQEIDPALETVLRSYPWPFAVTRKELARMLDRPLFQYAYYYEMPTDSVRLIELDTDNSAYELESDNRLATNAQSVRVKYVSKDHAMKGMDPVTQDVVALNLAARLCIIFTENPELQGQLWRQYEMQLAQARNTWAVENMPQTVIEGNWIPARFGAMRTSSVSETFNPWGYDGTGVKRGNNG